MLTDVKQMMGFNFAGEISIPRNIFSTRFFELFNYVAAIKEENTMCLFAFFISLAISCRNGALFEKN